jgi:hypothetical protein
MHTKTIMQRLRLANAIRWFPAQTGTHKNKHAQTEARNCNLPVPCPSRHAQIQPCTGQGFPLQYMQIPLHFMWLFTTSMQPVCTASVCTSMHPQPVCSRNQYAQHHTHIGLARNIHKIYTRYIRCIHGIFGRGITRNTVIYGAYI